jgi:hypothetical protein
MKKMAKILRRGKVTVLAVVVTLMLGGASTAFAANGGNFILGQSNAATEITRLTGTVVGGPALRLINLDPGAGATALELRVGSGKAPLKVNSDTRVANLNADELDGQDSSAFLGADQKAADSELLDGQDSTEFLASDGKAADSELLDGRELSSGRVARNEPPVGGSAFTLLEAGDLRLVRVCQRNSSGDARAEVRISTTEAGSAFSAHSVELGGVERSTLNPGDSSGVIASTGLTTSADVDHATYSAVAPNGDTLQGEVFAGVNVQGNTCVFSASGID